MNDGKGLTRVFEDAAAWSYPQLTLTETGHEPLRVNATETTPNFFSALGVQPVLGAGFPKSPFYSREGIAVISRRAADSANASGPDGGTPPSSFRTFEDGISR